MNDKIAQPVAAATIMLLRDGPTGLEVFMVVRHHQIDFASGALVFPGGKVDPQDGDARVVSQVNASLSTASWRLYVLRPGDTDSCWITSGTRITNASSRRFLQTQRWPWGPMH